MKPRASASFCHWPKDTSTPSGHVGPSCESSPAFRRTTPSSAPARATAVTTAASSSRRGRSPSPTDCRALSWNRKKSWNAPASRSPFVSPHARELRTVYQDPAGARLVEFRQEFHEGRLPRSVFADEGHDGPGRQIERDIVQDQAVGSRVRKR